MKNSSLKQAINFANRNNIQEEGYQQKFIKTHRKSIDDILIIKDKRSQPLHIKPSFYNSRNLKELTSLNHKYEKNNHKLIKNKKKIWPLDKVKRRDNLKNENYEFQIQSGQYPNKIVKIPSLNNYLHKYHNKKLVRRSLEDPITLINKQLDKFHKKQLGKGLRKINYIEDIELPSINISPKSETKTGCSFSFKKSWNEISSSVTKLNKKLEYDANNTVEEIKPFQRQKKQIIIKKLKNIKQKNKNKKWRKKINL